MGERVEATILMSHMEYSELEERKIDSMTEDERWLRKL